MKIAAVNWKLRPVASLEEFLEHFLSLLNQADGCDLIVFPELMSLEMLGSLPNTPEADVPSRLTSVTSPIWPLVAQLAADRSCVIVAGSAFVEASDGIFNVSVVALPDGRLTMDVPKVVLTQYETNVWNLYPGRGLRRLPDTLIGVTVCYDSEFPESGRRLADSGVLIQCVPAFTETAYGFHRVRNACRARAVENQVIVVHASLVGSLGCEPVPTAFGSSAVIGPCTPPFPEDGIIAETDTNQEGIAIAEIDLGTLLEARQSGDVRNWEDRNKGDWTIKDPIFVE